MDEKTLRALIPASLALLTTPASNVLQPRQATHITLILAVVTLRLPLAPFFAFPSVICCKRD